MISRIEGRRIIPTMKKKPRLFWFALVFGLVVALALGMGIPSVRERVDFKLTQWKAEIYYWLYPPQKNVFVPQDPVAAVVDATMTALFFPTPVVSPTASPTVQPTGTLQPTLTPTASPTPPPAKVILNGAVHEYQKWNNCGPATLAMALSYWKWKGDQRDVAAVLRPNTEDKNVFPSELADFVNTQTRFKALVRVGGDLETLKRLLAAGFPVVVEKSFDIIQNEGWVGHYELLTGYDDSRAKFISQDAYIMADFPVPYTDLEKDWLSFNRVFLVVYPPERIADVLAALGSLSDETTSYQMALQQSYEDILTHQGREQYFAWYNQGSSLVLLKDYTGAASAYDQAFRLYAQLPEDVRPWRLIWYAIGPYEAYYQTGRFQDVIDLATQTVSGLSEPAVEESFYWRAMAKIALGDTTGGVKDLRTSLKWHPGYALSLAELQNLGETP